MRSFKRPIRYTLDKVRRWPSVSDAAGVAYDRDRRPIRSQSVDDPNANALHAHHGLCPRSKTRVASWRSVGRRGSMTTMMAPS